MCAGRLPMSGSSGSGAAAGFRCDCHLRVGAPDLLVLLVAGRPEAGITVVGRRVSPRRSPCISTSAPWRCQVGHIPVVVRSILFAASFAALRIGEPT